MNIMLRNALRKNIGLRHQLEKNLLGNEGDIWEQELKKFLRQEPCWAPIQKNKEPMPQLLKLIASGVSISEAPAVKTVDCFKIGDGVFAYRDSDFDRWLPETVPAVGAGTASTLELAKEPTFQEMTAANLGAPCNSVNELKRALIEKGRCWSPKQIDELIRNCEKGKNPLKLRTDGYASIFFIEVGGNVFAVFAFRHSDGWRVGILEFAHADRWNVENRASFRN
ncbi:MAG: hypothetical protein HYW15_00055 [Candidatus Giovannonibacteria bacterium]|nr:MAG: hypothetical protein HYW15_00055 [Candidatus Giovannonibacteria bacterium]